MFCQKCGAQIAEGADFCHKCGARAIHIDGTQQPVEAIASVDTSPQGGMPEAAVAGSTLQTPSNHPPKEKNGLRRAAGIGRVLMWASLILMMISSFVGLPISPVILAIGVAVGIILSALGAKRPLGLSRILELVSAVVLLVVIAVVSLSSSGTNDQYVQMVKEGTLNGYPQKTVGEAFDGFLKNPKWESGLSDDDQRFVNVTGKILYYDEEVNLAVQFIVDEKSGSFEYNACRINDVPQNNLTFWGLLEAIYDDDSAAGEDSSSTNLAS